MNFTFLISLFLILATVPQIVHTRSCVQSRMETRPSIPFEYWKGHADRWPTYGSGREHPYLNISGMLDQGPEQGLVGNILFNRDVGGAWRILRFKKADNPLEVAIPDGILFSPISEWRCLLAPGDIAFLSDGFTDHAATVFSINESEGQIFLVDPRHTESFLLADNSPLVQHDGELFVDDATGIRGVSISFENFERVLIEAVLVGGMAQTHQIALMLSSEYDNLEYWDLIYWQTYNSIFGTSDVLELQSKFSFLDRISESSQSDPVARAVMEKQSMQTLRRILLFRRIIFLTGIQGSSDGGSEEILERTIFFSPESIGRLGRIQVIKDLSDNGLHEYVIRYYYYLRDNDILEPDLSVIAYFSCGLLWEQENNLVSRDECLQIRQFAYDHTIARVQGMISGSTDLEKVRLLYHTTYVSNSIRLAQYRLGAIVNTDQIFGLSKDIWEIYAERYGRTAK